jgi:hypothetical protein
VIAIEPTAITAETAAMNKTIRNTTMTIALVSLAASAILIAQPDGAAAAAKSMSRAVALPALPPGLIVPERLPRAIRDPQLLAAWIELYNHTESIALWDGSSLTGRDLAQYVLDNRIPIVWDVDGICHGSSCSVLACTESGCTYMDQAPGVDPLYIRPTLQGDAAGTLNALAHEIFHRTQPFGAVADTQFEEYWAYRVGNAIAPKTWPVFAGYDPMLSGWLFLWLRDNHMAAYYPLADYPPSIARLLAGPN